MSKQKCRNRIRIILAEKELTNTYLAEQLGVSKMTVSRWTTNNTQPNVYRLLEISNILGCNLTDLLELNN